MQKTWEETLLSCIDGLGGKSIEPYLGRAAQIAQLTGMGRVPGTGRLKAPGWWSVPGRYAAGASRRRRRWRSRASEFTRSAYPRISACCRS